jgi:anti-anti-sigma factor
VVVHLQRDPTDRLHAAVPKQRPSGERHVAVVGEIDIGTAPDLARLLRRHLGELVAGETLVIDLSPVSHLSAAGLHVLQDVVTAARDRRVRIRVSRVSWQVERALVVSGIDLRDLEVR